MSVFLTMQATGAVYWDAVGSIAVSALLGVVAITLIQRNRKWLIGKSMPKVRHTGFCVSSLILVMPLCDSVALLGQYNIAEHSTAGVAKRDAALSMEWSTCRRHDA
jgi:hypothetical protein